MEEIITFYHQVLQFVLNSNFMDKELYYEGDSPSDKMLRHSVISQYSLYVYDFRAVLV